MPIQTRCQLSGRPFPFSPLTALVWATAHPMCLLVEGRWCRCWAHAPGTATKSLRNPDFQNPGILLAYSGTNFTTVRRAGLSSFLGGPC